MDDSSLLRVKGVLNSQTGLVSAKDIQTKTRLSQPTIARALQKIPGLLSVGKARSQKYALARNLEGLVQPNLLLSIDDKGQSQVLGNLSLISHRGSLFQGKNSEVEVYPDIPYYLWDLRPQGFLGKLFVEKFQKELRLPESWRDWNEVQFLRSFVSRGENLVGDLLIGDESFRRWQAEKIEIIKVSARAKKFDELSDGIFDSEMGSSIGGEQPKFTACVGAGEKSAEHVIVKFSPPLNSDLGERWADLLLSEYWALHVLKKFGYPAAETEIVEGKNKVYLQSTRFDRAGYRGRKGLLSAQALALQFTGNLNNWTDFAEEISKVKKLSVSDKKIIKVFDCFGALIANTDRHFGNLSFYYSLRDQKNLKLAPAYDMLPMFFAPMSGVVREKKYQRPPQSIHWIEVWDICLEMAAEFWSLVAKDPRVSKSFRNIAHSQK